jgi:hypothetical protein
MKYNITMIQKKPKGTAHCSVLKDGDSVQTWNNPSLAKSRAIHLSNSSIKYIVSKHWR